MIPGETRALEVYPHCQAKFKEKKIKHKVKNLQIQLLFTNVIVEEKGYCNFKFAPTTFWQLKGWRFYHSNRIVKAWMQLKNNLLDNSTKILICCPTNIYWPPMWLSSDWQTDIFIIVSRSIILLPNKCTKKNVHAHLLSGFLA